MFLRLLLETGLLFLRGHLRETSLLSYSARPSTRMEGALITDQTGRCLQCFIRFLLVPTKMGAQAYEFSNSLKSVL